ncbi:MAG: zf-HC2 domain-containing protein, partial [Bryocella sp.]
MTCESTQQNIMLAQYGELADELQLPLEQHLAGCEDCRREWHALIALHEDLGATVVAEPTPNLLTASRLRLEEALDAMPARSMWQRVVGDGFRWMSTLKGAPALATLLIGCGFIGGTAVSRYEEAHVKRIPAPVIVSGSEGAIASVSGIV